VKGSDLCEHNSFSAFTFLFNFSSLVSLESFVYAEDKNI